MPLDGEQRVRCFNRAMLPRVTRQNHAGIVIAGQAQEFEHLPAANLSGLVHDNQRAGNHFALEQKICDRGWRWKPGLFPMSTTCWRCGARTTTRRPVS